MSTLTDVRCDCGATGQREHASGRFSDMLNDLPWMCPACVERREALELAGAIAGREAERKARMEHRVAQLPPRLRLMRLETLDRTDANDEAIHTATEWAEGHIPGLMLCGEFGVGKTTIAAAAAARMMRRRSVTWTSVPSFMANAMAALDTEARAQALSVLTGNGALVLDDLDKVRATEWASAQLFAAVDARYAAGAPLLITSNLTPGQMASRLHGEFGEAIASRLVEHCRVVTVTGPDRRLA